MTAGADTLINMNEPWPEEAFVAALRAQGARYHDLHPFHVRMNDGELTPRGARDAGSRTATTTSAASRSRTRRSSRTARSRDVRREWIQRILDHDGSRAGHRRHRVVAPSRRGTRRDRDEVLEDERLVLPGVRYAVDAYVTFCAHAAVGRGGRLVADRALRPRRDHGPPGGDGAALSVDRPGRARLLPHPARPGAARRRVRARARRRALHDPRAAGSRGRSARLQVRPALGAARGDRPRRHATGRPGQ